PINLPHGPAGGVWIADYYREIIEDYSAIPRYLQQQYGLIAGEDHGRLWRLAHDKMPKVSSKNMAALTVVELAREVGRPHFWRRQTARRLLIDRNHVNDGALAILTKIAVGSKEAAGAINSLYTLDGLNLLSVVVVETALTHHEPSVRRHALRLAERRFGENKTLLRAALRLVEDKSSIVRLQVALSLGESTDARATTGLARLAMRHSNDEWLNDAILSSLANRTGEMLTILLEKPTHASRVRDLIGRLCTTIAARRNAKEFS
ncbi:uncharacterized protein METZ01_LOCUS438457, partial [marine metagenome]